MPGTKPYSGLETEEKARLSCGETKKSFEHRGHIAHGNLIVVPQTQSKYDIDSFCATSR